jgi:protection of telomeres protein 1
MVRLDDKSNQETVLPFHACKYRANVRVVNYFPARVEDFAVGRRVTEYDILSDYSGGEDTDVEADRQTFKSGKGFVKKYEWRFALEVEDADPTAKRERMWLLVDNHSAQALLNLDATK